ncbi:AAA family ATPase [Sphaerotilus sp.]|uniref:AAA family ATPase n=1 Tax=Sphaerotilus sp. TaxID=2093942 RepID=UPI002ACDB681|nr:AAA family ATPase [Sphaerotilus sp.]MDZ7855763.1 AAA family ATPase [Sphaerotilus sp.]
MQPLALTLKGFRGIRDGLGRDEITLDLERLTQDAQLIAIVGANGSGKSTIMDCLVPFIGLPSRAALAGAGGFSYYDHVYLPESLKDLTWAHEGRSYRSQIVIRLNGRLRTQAYLHMLDDAGVWRPVRLDDGTVSDGRVETYTCCVEAICGSAETFFTSVFAAQGKRQLSTYRNAEIKSLLADLLGQEEIRALGQKAAETVRLLKAGLATIRQDLSGLDAEGQRLEATRRRLEGAGERVFAAERAKTAAHAALEAVQALHARVVVEREQAQATEVRRVQLIAERQTTLDTSAQTRRALQTQDQAERQRLGRLGQRVAGRLQQERSRRQALTQSRQRCLAVLAEAGEVQRADRRLPLAQHVQVLRSARTEACREKIHALTQCQGAVRLAEQRVAGIEREAGRAALRAEELACRFGLAGEVPCAGTDLQGRCKLLGDAREAQALIPSAQAQVARLAGEKSEAQQELIAARLRSEALAGAPQNLARAERHEAIARERVSCLAVLRSKAPACSQAQTTLIETERELQELGPEAAADAVAETPDERAERQQVAASRQTIEQQLDRQASQAGAALARLDHALASLSPAFDERQVTEASRTLGAAREALGAAEQAMLTAVREMQTLEEVSKQEAGLAERREQVRARSARVEDELGNWSLFARCMSNDGLIALAIDDAGPALSALANDLLLACYGPRFTLSIHTLLETTKGEQKEGFDIVVHDGDTGESKSVSLMSGGERTFVESCLTRAIALYLARNTGRRYTTLFTDEADGALDPQRKRMFMAMKREVLRLGGYEREFFVSQTPELTAMADAVIDLDALKVDGVEAQRFVVAA